MVRSLVRAQPELFGRVARRPRRRYGRPVKRILLLVFCAFLFVLAASAPAQAKSGDDHVVITGPVTIGPGQTAGDVWVANGDVTVAAGAAG